MKRLTLLALLAGATAVCTIAVARAAQPTDFTVTVKTINLRPPQGSEFPDASGLLELWIAGPYYDYTRGWPVAYYKTVYSVQVWGLAPECGYRVYASKGGTGYAVAGCTTDAEGNGSASNSLRGRPSKPMKYSVVDTTTGAVELSN